MTKNIDISKRILMLFIAFWITFVSVFSAYQESCECAEYVAGIVTATASGPLLTALLVGGAVVAGGIAVYKIATTTPEDYRNFKSDLKTGFQEFVAEREKQIALEENQNLTDQEASDLGVANAREHVNNFWTRAVDTTRRSATGIKQKTMQYWKEFNAEISDVADNGISESTTEITPTTVIQPLTYNKTGKNLGTYEATSGEILGEKCKKVDDAWYIVKGNFGSENLDYSASNNYGLPFVEIRVNLNENNEITSFNLVNLYINSQTGVIYQRWSTKGNP